MKNVQVSGSHFTHSMIYDIATNIFDGTTVFQERLNVSKIYMYIG